jgi:hypothetical protein
VTDFENKFIPRPFNSLQPIPHLAAPAFCAALFYPEFATLILSSKIGSPTRLYPHFAAHVPLAKSPKIFISKANFTP